MKSTVVGGVINYRGQETNNNDYCFNLRQQGHHHPAEEDACCFGEGGGPEAKQFNLSAIETAFFIWTINVGGATAQSAHFSLVRSLLSTE